MPKYKGHKEILPAGEKVKLKDYRDYGRIKRKSPSKPLRKAPPRFRSNPKDKLAKGRMQVAITRGRKV